MTRRKWRWRLTAGARIVGVNNRNLKDFTVDIHNSVRLRELVPENILFVSESGMKTRQDIAATGAEWYQCCSHRRDADAKHR